MTVPGFVLDAVKFVLGAFVGSAITKRVEGKADLVSYFGHSSAFTARPLGQPPFVIHTHDVVIQNAEKNPAKNRGVSRAVLPEHSNVSPSVPSAVEKPPAGKRNIVTPKVVPAQLIVFSSLSYPPLLWSQVHAGI